MIIRHSELTFMNEDNLEMRSNKKKTNKSSLWIQNTYYVAFKHM